MSPSRIGSIELTVLMIRAMLNCSPTLVTSMVPLGFSVGIPGAAAIEDRHHHLRPGAHAPVDVQLDLAPIVIHVGDVAVGVIEDRLLPLDLVAELADDLR